MSAAALHQGDCREVLRGMADASVDSCVTDPPYHLTTGKKGGSGPASVNLESPYGRARIGTGFMGMKWDGGDIAQDPALWAEVLRVLKPGGYLLAFSGTRTYHRMTCAIEDAGFEIRDQIGWAFGSGFPKSHNGEWGGTALKPAWEPICMARKPLIGTVAQNVLAHGTGALNIDGCRIEVNDAAYARNASGDRGHADNRERAMDFGMTAGSASEIGRWPANLCHDGSEEVLAAFPQARSACDFPSDSEARNGVTSFSGKQGALYADTGSAARFFYCAKASREDRNEGSENNHPTVKPTDLMRWLCRLVTPKGGLVLDPFMGSGSTGKAAMLEGFRFIGIERDPQYIEIARARTDHAKRQGHQTSLLADIA